MKFERPNEFEIAAERELFENLHGYGESFKTKSEVLKNYEL
jgi:hypothetical protein